MTPNTKGTRTIAVRLSAEYHRAIRTLAATHGLDNAQVITWAIELLQRHIAEGGNHVAR